MLSPIVALATRRRLPAPEAIALSRTGAKRGILSAAARRDVIIILPSNDAGGYCLVCAKAAGRYAARRQAKHLFCYLLTRRLSSVTDQISRSRRDDSMPRMSYASRPATLETPTGHSSPTTLGGGVAIAPPASRRSTIFWQGLSHGRRATGLMREIEVKRLPARGRRYERRDVYDFGSS